jgi:hypothetical protein
MLHSPFYWRILKKTILLSAFNNPYKKKPRNNKTVYMLHSPFYWRILKKTILLSAFNNPYKKTPETIKLESFHETHFVERKNEGRKPDESSSLRRLEFMPSNLD